MGRAIFSVSLAMLALSNAASHPRDNNGEVCYCAAPGRGEGACLPAGKLRHGAKGCVGAAQRPGWCPTGLPSSGWLHRCSLMLAAVAGMDGRREGWRGATTPTQPSPASPPLPTPPRSGLFLSMPPDAKQRTPLGWGLEKGRGGGGMTNLLSGKNCSIKYLNVK